MKRTFQPIRLCAVLASAFLLQSCALRSEPAKLQMTLPDGWRASTSGTQTLKTDWWTDFGSVELNRMLEIALTDSPDLRIAAERIRQADASLTGTNASLFPSVGLSASSARRRTEPSGGQPITISESANSSLSVSYEVDLWGRLSANSRAAQASLQTSRYDLETVRLTLFTGIANTYFQALALRARLAVARENLVISERLLRIVDVRYRNGAASALDLSRQKTAVLTQRATIQPLEIQERQTVNALAVLLGQPPQNLQIEGQSLLSLGLPDVSASLPSELLVRRPDLASIESQLLGADADLDAARAALLPSLQLSGSGGSASAALFSLADASRSLSLTASIFQSIFDAGRLRSQVEISEAQRRQLLENYRKAVLTALKEVEDALSNVIRYRDQELAQLAIRKEAERSLKLAELRYREGADDLSTVLDAQRTLYSVQDQLAQLRLSRLGSAVDMIKVLGGAFASNSNVTAATQKP